MIGVKKIAGFISLLTLTLWFALSFGTAFASSDAAHAPAAADAVVAVDAHAADTGSHAVPNSLSAAKLKDLGWRIVNFIALMIILVKFGAKPIGSGLSARRTKIKDEIETLERKKVEAEQSYNDFQAKLSGVESEIDKVVDRAIAQAEVEKTKIIEKAEQAASEIMRSAEMTVQNEVTQARRILKNDAAEQAAVIAEQLIVKNLTVDDQVKIIENYLDKVGAVQ
ncbi:MAG: F-type H+-transporting ATPase subunit b [Desulforhopalus sp.]|jgi:F-type H+-transporting ATPase subunit b